MSKLSTPNFAIMFRFFAQPNFVTRQLLLIVIEDVKYCLYCMERKRNASCFRPMVMCLEFHLAQTLETTALGIWCYEFAREKKGQDGNLLVFIVVDRAESCLALPACLCYSHIKSNSRLYYLNDWWAKPIGCVLNKYLEGYKTRAVTSTTLQYEM